MQFKVKVFLSYSVVDKNIAEKLAQQLQYYPFIDIFMAPNDIRPGTLWVDELKFNLKNSDVLLALLTNNYHGSDWTEQEIGLAWAFEKRILALSLDGNMGNGYIKSFQIKNFPTDFNSLYLSKLAIDLYPTIDNKEEFVEAILKFGLLASTSFYQSNAIASLIQRLVDHLKPEQATFLKKAYIQNDQVTYATKWNKLIEESFYLTEPFILFDTNSRKELLSFIEERQPTVYLKIQNEIDARKNST